MSEPFLAEVRLFGFNFAPRGWAQCDGQILPIDQNQSLYSLLGTTYGGDGRTTFALPELRGRAAAHEGTGAGLPTKSLGQKGGFESVALAAAEMPPHTHQLVGDASPANSNSPSGRRYAQTGTPIYHAPDAPNAVAMNASALGSTGANFAHDNMQPYQAINFCIAVQGVFPSRN